MLQMRRSGTSTLIERIATENDVYVLVPDAKLGERFGSKALTFDQLGKFGSEKSKPILVDNHALLVLTARAIDGYQQLEEKVYSREALIKDIKHLILNFEGGRDQRFSSPDVVPRLPFINFFEK